MAGRKQGGFMAPLQQEHPGGWTEPKREAFLDHLAQSCNIAASCRAVGMSEAGLYKLKARDAEFRAGMERAVAESYAKLELMMLERFMYGTTKTIREKGRIVREITEYSDRVAMGLLQAHRETAARVRETNQHSLRPDAAAEAAAERELAQAIST